MDRTNKVINAFLCICASAAIGAGGMYLYCGRNKKIPSDYKLAEECRKILDDGGVKLPEGTDTQEALVKAYLSTYNDRYTFYTHDDNTESYLSSINGMPTPLTSGFQVGIGENGDFVVTEVTAGSTADQQGLKTGDVILSVDGVSVAEAGIKKAAYDIQNVEGSVMSLELLRDGEPLHLDFVRANDPKNKSENIEIMPVGDVCYIRISFLDNYSAALLNGKLNNAEKYNKIVFDLRNSPGGLMEGAVQCADFFIDGGVVRKHENNGDTSDIATSDDSGDIKVPMCVLVNENTASAAEIFAALLKQYGDDVKLVGMNTFGKGIYQYDETLSNGGVLHYTAGYYTVGDWECYQGTGIAPDIEVPMDSSLIGTDDDVQLKKCLDLLG